MNARNKVLIVGMDGASPQLLFPWAAEGKLPNLARLMARGRYGTLLSTMPPATFPAWSSFMTGTNPGKHGLFDFTTRVEHAYAVEFVNSTYRKMPTIWRLLDEAGLRTGVMGMPSTYPPEELDGFMISGFDSPVATGIEGSFVRPRGLYRDIRRNVGEYLITDFQELRIGPGWHDRAVEGLRKTVDRKTDIACWLLEREDVDVFCVLFGESDTVSHHFWSAFDERSPRFSGELAEKHGGAISDVYRRIDASIGRILEHFPDDTQVIVASDHGFGGSSDRVVHLNRWLEERGYLARRKGGSPLVETLEGVKSRLLDIVPVRLQEQVFRRAGGMVANTLESRLRFGSIDWGGTAAFSEELNYFPSVWINTRGREPEGLVNPGQEYEDFRDELIGDLESWIDPESGNPVVARAWKREELYWGKEVFRAPDIILELSLESGYSYNVLPSRTAHGGPPLRTLDRSELIGSKGKGMNGSHRRDGVWIAAGPSVPREEEPFERRIWDPAVTVLEHMNVEVPTDMDGTGLEPGDEHRPAARSVTREPGDSAPAPLSASEQEEIARRLRSLGYLG